MSPRTFVRASLYFAKTYVTAMPRVLYRCTLSLLLDPRGAQEFVHQVLTAAALESDDPVLGSTEIVRLLGTETRDVHIVGPYHLRGIRATDRLLEVAILAFLVRTVQPQLVIEFGTSVGRTTRLFAANVSPDCKIVTVDLPPSHAGCDVGIEFRGTPEAGSVQQILGDSRRLDVAPWEGKADFVWVDGGHEYDCVLSDSRNALRVCRPGGWIAWHDYWPNAWWGDVTRCVRELRNQYPGIVHLRGTAIAILQKPK